MSSSILPMFSSKSFIVSGPTLKRKKKKIMTSTACLKDGWTLSWEMSLNGEEVIRQNGSHVHS